MPVPSRRILAQTPGSPSGTVISIPPPAFEVCTEGSSQNGDISGCWGYVEIARNYRGLSEGVSEEVSLKGHAGLRLEVWAPSMGP